MQVFYYKSGDCARAGSNFLFRDFFAQKCAGRKKGLYKCEKCAIINKPCGGVAQLGERSVRIREVKGSNPSVSTILTKRYRCVWRKVRRINRFRAFSGPDFFFQTIDANRCFRASAPIRTGRFPFSGRCVQPVPFLNGVFPAGSCIFLKKRITKIWASFCWS